MMPLALVHMFMIYTFGLRIVKKLKKRLYYYS